MTSCIAAPMRIRWDKPYNDRSVSGILGSPQSPFYVKVTCDTLNSYIRFTNPNNSLIQYFDCRKEETLKELQQTAQRLWDEMWFSLSDYDFSTTNTPAP